MVSLRTAAVGCALAAMLDLMSSGAVLLAAASRESSPPSCSPAGAWAGVPFFVCSFWDLLPVAGGRLAAMILTLGLAAVATRDWKPRQGRRSSSSPVRIAPARTGRRGQVC